MSATSCCRSARVRARNSRRAIAAAVGSADDAAVPPDAPWPCGDGTDAWRRPSSPLSGLKGVLSTEEESPLTVGRTGVALRTALDGEADLRMISSGAERQAMVGGHDSEDMGGGGRKESGEQRKSWPFGWRRACPISEFPKTLPWNSQSVEWIIHFLDTISYSTTSRSHLSNSETRPKYNNTVHRTAWKFRRTDTIVYGPKDLFMTNTSQFSMYTTQRERS